jgi:hypothetical protein
MAYVNTQGLWIPALPIINLPPAFTLSPIDATGEKFAWIGKFWNKDRTSKDIRKVHFRAGTVTSAGGSGLTLSLQNVDTATGPPYQPDGTQDQTAAIALNTISSNSWVTSGNLSADRTVAFGELFAAVIEYDGGGRLGADALNLTNLQLVNAVYQGMTNGCSLLSGTWAAISVIPNIIFEDSSGGFGTFEHAWPASATNATTFNTGSTPDERALEFSFPFPCKVDGAWAYVLAAANAEFDMILYEGTSALATVSADLNTISSAAAPRIATCTFAPQTLAANTTYRLAIKPTTANNVTLYDFDVNAAGHFDAHAGGQALRFAGRADAGAWDAATTTKRPYAGLRISALDDGRGARASYRLGI